VDLLSHEGILLVYCKLVHQDAQVLQSKAAFQLVSISLLEPGVIPPQVPDLAFPIVEFHDMIFI